MNESDYTKLFDQICKECDPENISLHSFGAIFWDHQQNKIDKLKVELKKADYIWQMLDKDIDKLLNELRKRDTEILAIEAGKLTATEVKERIIKDQKKRRGL